MKYDTLYSYVDTIEQTGKHSLSPYGVTSYDVYRMMKKGKGVLKERKKYRRLTKEQMPKWKKMYAAYVRWGMSLEGAKRKASGKIKGKMPREVWGHTEEYLVEEKYDTEPLFKMHKWFEEMLEFQWKLDLEQASQDEINVEFQTQEPTKNRRFAWQMTAFEGIIMYHIIYEKGKILESEMWESFDFIQFHHEIREQQVWE